MISEATETRSNWGRVLLTLLIWKVLFFYPWKRTISVVKLQARGQPVILSLGLQLASTQDLEFRSVIAQSCHRVVTFVLPCSKRANAQCCTALN